MALTRVDLSIELAVSSDCSTITLEDTTSDYGGSGKATINSVTSVTAVVNITGGSYFTYAFTVSSGTITAATLSLSGGTATTITSELESTVWPFTSTPFDLWGDYGVTLPTFADGVVEVEYTIAGTINLGDGPITYNYTTSEAVTIPCVELCQCVTEMGQEIDPTCEDEDKIYNFLKADMYLKLATFNTEIGNTERAAECIIKASDLCDCNCSGCS